MTKTGGNRPRGVSGKHIGMQLRNYNVVGQELQQE